MPFDCDRLLPILVPFGEKPFSTSQFVEQVKATAPDDWTQIELEYGAGGRGSGKHYSANSRVSQWLQKRHVAGKLNKLDYRAAPPTWGSPVVRFWSAGDGKEPEAPLFPDEVVDEVFVEGAVTQVTVNRYERNLAARQKCIDHHGATCWVCSFDFEARYGEPGKGFIHVHHLVPLSTIQESYEVDPINDLIPVCPNCHAMIHRWPGAKPEEALKALVVAQIPISTLPD